MSHYAVAVFSDDGNFDRLLKRYDENNEQYFVFAPEQDITGKYDSFIKRNPDLDYTFNDYVDAFEYIKIDDTYGHMYNPFGYWDWYVLDGRDYLFDLKDGAKLDDGFCHYRKNDYNWYPYSDDDDADEAAKFWDNYIEVDNPNIPVPGIYKREYYLERYKTKEQYIKEACRTVPYAFITPDGVWHAPGMVGWFGISNETDESANKYIEEWDAWISSDENPYVSLVDCHI